jgi:hypothetical protein
LSVPTFSLTHTVCQWLIAFTKLAELNLASLANFSYASLFDFDSLSVALSNMGMLLKKDAVEKAFVEQVIQSTSRDVERRARGLAEWVSDKTTRNVADAACIFARRVGERKAEIARTSASLDHSVSDRLHFSAEVDGVASVEQLMSGLSDAAADLTANFKPDAEGKRIADSLSASVMSTIAVELGAAGVMGALLSVSALDVFGVASTGVLATGGLLVLPRRRRVLRTEIRARVTLLRSRLEKELRGRVDQHMQTHGERVQVAVDPFASFASTRAEATDAQLAALRKGLHGLRAVASDLPPAAVTAVSTGASSK